MTHRDSSKRHTYRGRNWPKRSFEVCLACSNSTTTQPGKLRLDSRTAPEALHQQISGKFECPTTTQRDRDSSHTLVFFVRLSRGASKATQTHAHPTTPLSARRSSFSQGNRVSCVADSTPPAISTCRLPTTEVSKAFRALLAARGGTQGLL